MRPGSTRTAPGRVAAVNGAQTAGPRPWWRSGIARRRAVDGYIAVLPWILGFLIFTAYPIAASAYYSLTEFPILTGPTWVGVENYRALFFDDDLFWKSLAVTAIYSLAAVPSGVIVGYLIALLLNQNMRGQSVWRTIYFLPAIVPTIASAYLWSWLENQVLVAVKTLPLGQQAGQAMLVSLQASIAVAVQTAMILRDEELGSLPAIFVLCSARHEALYSRLYRS